MARAERRFAYLIKDLSEGDLAALLDHERMESRVFDYKFDERTVYQCAEPWPIVWLLARTSPKFVFHGKEVPKMETLRRDANSFVNRLAWKYHFLIWAINTGTGETY